MGKICRQFLTTLRKRKAINSILDKVSGDELTAAEIERLGEELLSYGEQAVPLLIKKLKNSSTKEIERLLPLIEYLQLDEVVESLFEILKTRNMNDILRGKILSALRNLEKEMDISFPIPGLNTHEYVNNALYYLSNGFLNRYERNEELIITFLEDFLSCDIYEKLQMVKSLCNIKDLRTIPILRRIAEDIYEEVALLALQGLGRIRSYEAVSALIDYLSFPRLDCLKREAERSLQRLKFCGFSQGRKRIKHAAILYSLASLIDGSGNQTFWVGKPKKNGKIESACFIINETWGLRDCFGGVPLDISEFEITVEDSSAENTFRYVDIAYIGKMISDALYTNKINNTRIPAEFLLRRDLLGRISIYPERYNPQFEGFDLDRIKKDLFLKRSTAEIFDIKEFKGWVISDERIYEYAELIIKDGRRGALKNYPIFYGNIYREMVKPKLKVLGRRLILTADLINRADNDRSTAEVLLCAGLNLIEGDEESLYTHPFVKRFIFETLNSAILSLLRGSDPVHGRPGQGEGF